MLKTKKSLKPVVGATAVGASLLAPSAFALQVTDLTTAYTNSNADALIDQGGILVLGAALLIMAIGLIIRVFRKG